MDIRDHIPFRHLDMSHPQQKVNNLCLQHNECAALAVTSSMWSHTDSNEMCNRKTFFTFTRVNWFLVEHTEKGACHQVTGRQKSMQSCMGVWQAGIHPRLHLQPFHPKRLTAAPVHFQLGWVPNHSTVAAESLTDRQAAVWADRHADREARYLRGFSCFCVFSLDQPDRKSMTLHSHGDAE